VCEAQFAEIVESCSQIVIRVGDDITLAAITDFEIDHFFSATIQKLVRIPAIGLESGAHPWTEHSFAEVVAQDRLSAEDVYEFILAAMGMAQGAFSARHQARKVDAKVGEAEEVAKRVFHPSRVDAMGEGFWIT